MIGKVLKISDITFRRLIQGPDQGITGQEGQLSHHATQHIPHYEKPMTVSKGTHQCDDLKMELELASRKYSPKTIKSYLAHKLNGIQKFTATMHGYSPVRTWSGTTMLPTFWKAVWICGTSKNFLCIRAAKLQKFTHIGA